MFGSAGMHALSNARSLPGVCSTSAPAPSSRQVAGRLRVCAAKDVMCKDVVNTRKKPASSMEGQATIVFAGVEGQEISVSCPKAGPLSNHLMHLCSMSLGSTHRHLMDSLCRIHTY